MPLIRRSWVRREMLREEPKALFVFGDNLARVGLGGQAKEMRGEPNAVGLPTKKSPYIFLSNADFETVRLTATPDIERLRHHLADGGVVIWPMDGIGTGLAQLRQKAPRIADWYAEVLNDLKRIVALHEKKEGR